MNYVGQEIIHKGKYGKGRIIAQDEKYISVSFDSSKEPIKFVYPECFKRFLQLVDTEAAQRAEKENVRRDAVKEEEAEKKPHVPEAPQGDVGIFSNHTIM